MIGISGAGFTLAQAFNSPHVGVVASVFFLSLNCKKPLELNTPKTIQMLAESRIVEAECLFQNGHYDLAFYVAGYAVELYLKARISLVLNMPDFFDFENRKKFENEDSITKPYKVHNYT